MNGSSEPGITPHIAAGHPTAGSNIPPGDETTINAVRSELKRTWGIDEELQPLSTGSTSRVWRISNGIVKLARDHDEHFRAGLRASQAVETSGMEAGAPVLTLSGSLSTITTIKDQHWMLAVLHPVEGIPTSLHDIPPRVLGELLARIHLSMRDVDATGAWTVKDVLGHMRHGIKGEQPESIRQMISSAIHAVRGWYHQAQPRRQLIRGDGPELFVRDGVITGMTDWGGVRFGSAADDIGCWTLHGATQNIREYTAEFVLGYESRSVLTLDEEQAIPLFQQLRLASRACYITDPSSLAVLEKWMENIR
ncbi:phosphotransferase enzyme family protein [Paenibacillus humicola]|uniref:phosphotransferase enzyme family protein n=1 Tax=Paenibacillus humicola TaxID=3110540 RepID=UPI00237C004B|nr:hypothetical protein [Paenibacillus humicola]